MAQRGQGRVKFTVQVKVKADPTHEEAGGLTRGDEGQVWKNVC